MEKSRFFPLIISFSSLVLAEIILFSPKSIYVLLVLMVLLYFLAIRQFMIAGKRKEKLREFLILPTVFSLGLIFFSTMLTNRMLIHCLFLANSAFSYLYFRTVYAYLAAPKSYQKNSLENISSYGNFLGFYFIASTVYGLQIFLSLEIWRLMVALLAISLLIIYQVFWANRVDHKARLFYMLVLSLMIVELAWAISFMSLNYYILGLILAIFYYTIIGLARFYLLKTISSQTIKAYLALGITSVVLVLFTASWVSYN